MRVRLRIGLGALLVACAAGSAPAGSVSVAGVPVGNISIPVESLKEARFRTIVRQQHDFSCGSAAVATLLTHHYGDAVTEQGVFAAMFEKGDQAKIRKEGFSLLDMKRYLVERGYPADGFRVPLAKLREVRVPAIALINRQGYHHFVVVKGLNEREVLLGDPSAGVVVMRRDAFEGMWNGILFVIRRESQRASSTFEDGQAWTLRPKAPIPVALAEADLAKVTVLRPGAMDF